jgi:hypothetical protein
MPIIRTSDYYSKIISEKLQQKYKHSNISPIMVNMVLKAFEESLYRMLKRLTVKDCIQLNQSIMLQVRKYVSRRKPLIPKYGNKRGSL